jgi:ApaG protein
MPSGTMTIKVATRYVEAQSDPAKSRYVFNYTITITNVFESAITLRSRHWLITNDDNSKIEVTGDGVVGQQPTIAPNQSYEYTSGVVLTGPVGSMEGHYDMEHANGHNFRAKIMPFSLAIPNVIN